MTRVAAASFTLEPLGAIADTREAWSTLAAAAGNPFATVEWCEAWLEHAAAGAEPRVFAAVEDGRVAAIVPLVLVRGRYVRKLRFLGFGAANELGPICPPADTELGVQALRLALAQTRSDWDVFLGESLPGGGWTASLGAALVEQQASPVARGPFESWEAYLATRSSSMRKELRQKERRLPDARFRSVSSSDGLEQALDALFRLHRARWGEQASPFFAGLERFHRRFAESAAARGWLRLRFLELDGNPVAVNYSLRFGDIEWSYQHGRDPGLEAASIGTLVFAYAVRAAFAEGATEFKLGPGRQAYKLRFATGDPGLETVGIARGPRGRASLLAAKRRAKAS